jgi:hypothetical protein
MNECILLKRINNSMPDGMFTALTYSTHMQDPRIHYCIHSHIHTHTHAHWILYSLEKRFVFRAILKEEIDFFSLMLPGRLFHKYNRTWFIGP